MPVCFSHSFVAQNSYEKRSIFDSLDLAWSLLRTFPKDQLNRIPAKVLDEWYQRKAKGRDKGVKDEEPPQQQTQQQSQQQQQNGNLIET